MVEIDEFLSPERMVLGLRSGSKRQLFQELATIAAAATGLDAAVILAALNQREKLGTTGIGAGIAIPHARVKQLTSMTGFFARLATPVDYDALDDAPVDVVFLLLAPEEASTAQLKALARIARLLRDPEVCARLRRESDPLVVYNLLVGRAPGAAA
jgi:PTS system nitrogen regulatory IIA component